MEPYSSEFLHCMKEIVMKIVSVNMVKAKSIEKKTLCMYLLKCFFFFFFFLFAPFPNIIIGLTPGWGSQELSLQ